MTPPASEEVALKWVLALRSGTSCDERVDDGRFPVMGAAGAIGRTNRANAKADSIIIGRVGTAGAVNRVRTDCWASDNTIVATPGPNLTPPYAFYLLLGARLPELASKTAQPLLTASSIGNQRFRIPGLEEQRRIADFLDAETSKLEVLDDRFNKLTGLLEERKAALIAACFAFKATDDAPVLPLRRAVKRWIDYRGATPEKTEFGIPLVTAKNIRNGRIDLEASREFIAMDAYADWMRRGLLEVNDVLLTTEAPLGQVAMVKDTFIALAQRVIVLRVHQDVCSAEWLYWYLLSPQGQAELELRSTGSTALGIKADRLRGVPIPLPTLSEATQRLGQLADRVTQIEALQRKLAEQRALVTERRQTLITAAVTGQFDVTAASGRNVTEGVTV